MFPHAVYIDTQLEPDALREKLRAWEPWSQRIEFSNGVSTAEFERRVPFSDNPLSKLRMIEREVDLSSFRGEPVLDIGCSAGHNSFEMARHGARVTGVDHNDRHITVASFLAGVADLDVEFLRGDAEAFSRGGFSLSCISARFTTCLIRSWRYKGRGRTFVPEGRSWSRPPASTLPMNRTW